MDWSKYPEIKPAKTYDGGIKSPSAAVLIVLNRTLISAEIVDGVLVLTKPNGVIYRTATETWSFTRDEYKRKKKLNHTLYTPLIRYLSTGEPQPYWHASDVMFYADLYQAAPPGYEDQFAHRHALTEWQQFLNRD